ncbi:hypothetical protein LC612_31065 [Nostoc sp. CHAB 5834]|nr:hypothetical protein [Nostoc sp. CHAB 5834]
MISQIVPDHTPHQIIKELRENYDVKASLPTLERHLRYFEENPLPTRIEETLTPIPSSLAIHLNDVNFDSYNFNPEDGGSIIAYLQRMQLNEYLLISTIVKKGLHEYLSGESETLPSQAMSMKQKSHDMFMDLSGARNIIDLNVAIEKVTKSGYEVNKKDAV